MRGAVIAIGLLTATTAGAAEPFNAVMTRDGFVSDHGTGPFADLRLR